jgi:MFS family permease
MSLYPYFVQPLYKLSLPVAAHNETSRLRAAITVFFAADGFIFASWAVRIPAVKAAIGASPATLGIALLGASAGAIATMTLTGALCRRFGSARLTVCGGVWVSLALLLPALARSAVALGLALVVFGIGYGGLNVAMNSLAVDLVAAVRRPVMPSFHAAWSLGGLAGSALGGLAAPALTPLAHFSLVCLLGLAATGYCGRIVLTRPLSGTGPDGPIDSDGLIGTGSPVSTVSPIGTADPIDSAGPIGTGSPVSTGSPIGTAGPAGPAAARADEELQNGSVPRPARSARRRVWRTIVLLGTIALCSTYGEGAISDWGALHLHTDLGAGTGVAAAGYAAFALAEACGRLAGTELLDRLGQTRVLVYGGLVTCAGMLAAALAPSLPLALAGFALAGLGVANAFPTAMARVGLLAGPNGVAAASTFGYAGFLLGPPVIGFLASAVSLRAALTTVSLLALAAVALARAASPARQPG